MLKGESEGSNAQIQSLLLLFVKHMGNGKLSAALANLCALSQYSQSVSVSFELCECRFASLHSASRQPPANTKHKFGDCHRLGYITLKLGLNIYAQHCLGVTRLITVIA